MRKLIIPIGGIFVAWLCIGLVATVQFGVSHGIADDTAEYVGPCVALGVSRETGTLLLKYRKGEAETQDPVALVAYFEDGARDFFVEIDRLGNVDEIRVAQ